MLKRSFAILLVLMMMFSLGACGQKQASEEPAATEEAAATETKEDGNWKIGIMTGTVSQNEEEYRAAQNVLKKYGEEHVILMTYPDKFMDEQETTIANLVSMASDPDVKALIIVQAVPGTSAAIDKVKELRDDLLIIAGTPGEDPKMIASKADIVFAMDELSMGHTIIEQAKKQGAKTFVHYSFPRHMSYALLSARRDLFKENCEKLGLKFVDATAPDPTGDAGVSGAQQFILEDVPRKVEQYGKDTAFFSTNCAMQVPLIKASLDEGAIYPQPCCPSPYHGFPSALGIKIPEDKKGDINFVVDQIKEKIAEKNGTGRFSTWPVPVAMMFVEAGAEYAKAYIDGETNGKLDVEKVNEKFKEYAKVDITLSPLEESGVKYDNYLMVLLDFLNF
ncbi:DUF3798 domain-containing protein [Crassaminicella thermophila]|uniref:DUF3798 domain-containing protein n=1 Tax=Crassaminicella thermophila TaxID=2599308 RepID=A0A5C0SEY7_CRATE|nr:DUF3798 domain-containing protein [Crassaminicella thermophila]QEK12502.1 DUF3798 domain-containing protein [Crassaminicella thermophila]